QPEPITIEEPEIYKGNELITDFGENFQGHHFDAEEAALSIIKAYINNDKSLEYSHVIPYIQNFVDEFVENGNLQTTYTSEDGSEHSRWIPLKYFGESILPLQLVDTDGCAYYSDGNEFIIARADGSLATDYEFFYENAMLEALEQGNYKYKAENVQD
ncbi:MAG: hypothetical protein J6I68_11335, partial [Butyrivibrio sp.]|uniref:hypothetical protein n=1 Tax=Butyrivibrio sp. TaxID=28121 RepID=UPI001B6E5472